MSAAKHEPTPPSAKEQRIREDLVKHTRSPLTLWLRDAGWKILGPFVIIVLVAVGVLGLGPTVELLAGVKSPALFSTSADWLSTVLAWSMTVLGWLAAPALVGGIAGYVVSTRLRSYRQRTRQEVFEAPAP